MISPLFRHIFVIVAGALILIFFARFGANMIRTESGVESAMIIANLENSLTALSVSMETIKNFPEKPWSDNVELKIGKGMDCGRIFVKDQKKDSNKIIFSASRLKGNQLWLWIKPWSYPYPITNFFYMSNKQTKYYLIGSFGAELVNPNLEESIPPRFNVEYLPSNYETIVRVNAPHYDFVKIVSFGPEINIAGVRYAKINAQDCEEGKDDTECKGTVTFDNGRTAFFIGKAMLYGAIFAEDYDSYMCQFNRALSKMTMVTKLYKEKTEKLIVKNINCNKYTGMIDNLDAMQNANNADSFDYYKDNIIYMNKEISGDRDCITVF